MINQFKDISIHVNTVYIKTKINLIISNAYKVFKILKISMVIFIHFYIITRNQTFLS